MKIRTNMMTMKKTFLADNSELKEMEAKRNEVKFNKAKGLHKIIDKIRAKYRKDWTAADEKTKQHSVALYLIDTLAIRPGGSKDVDTFGCCSLHVSHVNLSSADSEISLDFPGKCSVRYEKTISVPKEVFKNLQQFIEGKSPTKEIFDKINHNTLNTYLKKAAGTDDVSSKIVRTYRACVEFEKKLKEYSGQDGDKKEQYKLALRDVARLLNHKKKRGKREETVDNLDTAKDYYLDPRITVAWCKRFNVPIKVVYSKGRREKFAWALKTTSGYKFAE
jgi:DNA topoisomerase-1